MTKILVVDDEQAFLDSVVIRLNMEGYRDVTAVADPLLVPDLAERECFDLALLDVVMPGMNGMDLLAIIKEKSPETECVMVTANDGIKDVIRAVKLGAYDYIVKPFSPDDLKRSMDKALEHGRMAAALRLKSDKTPPGKLRRPEAFAPIVTASPEVRRLLHEAELHAPSGIPVLVTGETGAGKELFARAIHAAGGRRGNFVAVNMPSVAAGLFESEFFGHVRGAFTGADRDRKGYLEEASGGTLFLDEIGDLSLELQAKLLRIIQEGEFAPVGSAASRPADVRFVAATNQDLAELARRKKFRKDLLYRLMFARLEVPPLRERPEDIPLLAEHFLNEAGGHRAGISDEAMEVLLDHRWPGNARELRGAVEAARNLAGDSAIRPEHLNLMGGPATRAGARQGGRAGGGPPGGEAESLPSLAEVEREHIIRAYKAAGENKSRAARVLGISLPTLHRKLKDYGV